MAVFPVKGLDGGVPVDEGDGNLAVFHHRRFFHDHDIPVEYAGVDHRVAPDPQREKIPAVAETRDVVHIPLQILIGRDGVAGRHRAQQRHLCDVRSRRGLHGSRHVPAAQVDQPPVLHQPLQLPMNIGFGAQPQMSRNLVDGRRIAVFAVLLLNECGDFLAFVRSCHEVLLSDVEIGEQEHCSLC